MTDGERGRSWSFIGAIGRTMSSTTSKPTASPTSKPTASPTPKPVPPPAPHPVGLKTAVVSLQTNDEQLRQLYRMVGKLRGQVEERSAAIDQLEAINSDLEKALDESLSSQEEQLRRIVIMQRALREAQDVNEELEQRLQYQDSGDEPGSGVDELEAFINHAASGEVKELSSSAVVEPARMLYSIWKETHQTLVEETAENKSRFRSILRTGATHSVRQQGATWAAYLDAWLMSIEEAEWVSQYSWEYHEGELVVRLDTYEQDISDESKAHIPNTWRSPWGVWIEACLVGAGQEQATLVSVEYYHDHELLFFSGLQPLDVKADVGEQPATDDIQAGLLSSSHKGNPSTDPNASTALLSGVGLSPVYASEPTSTSDREDEGSPSGDMDKLVASGDGAQPQMRSSGGSGAHGHQEPVSSVPSLVDYSLRYLVDNFYCADSSQSPEGIG